MKTAILVNGVPASGKSTVAKAISQCAGWPLLALDTVKEALFAQLGTGDRDHNRLFGKASYKAIFAVAADFPTDSTIVIDAWFGFQPTDVLIAHLQCAGVSNVIEVWCHAPPEVVGERYRARLASRPEGHLGASYIPELVALAARAAPIGGCPVVDVDTMRPLEAPALVARLKALGAG